VGGDPLQSHLLGFLVISVAGLLYWLWLANGVVNSLYHCPTDEPGCSNRELCALSDCSSPTLMATMSQRDEAEFFFVPYVPHRSRGGLALQETQRRAHAARRSHASRQRRHSPSTSGSPTISHLGTEKFQKRGIVLSETSKVQHQKHGRSRWRHRILSIQTPSPETILDQRRLDPFDSFAVKGLPLYVHKLLEVGESLMFNEIGPNTLEQLLLSRIEHII